MPFRIRPWHAALAMALLLGLAGFLYGIAGEPATPPRPFALADAPKVLPLIGFADAAGGRHTLEAYRGRYVLLNLWATWCAPCVEELPALARLKQAAPANVAVLVVNVGRDTAAQASGFLKEHDAAALDPFVDADIALVRKLGAYGLPVTILIDPEGREIGRAMGAVEWDSGQSLAYFAALRKQQP